MPCTQSRTSSGSDFVAANASDDKLPMYHWSILPVCSKNCTLRCAT
ncbi:Uncharacterised protein [Mycobacteroides abscessus subsp. abscessus]|nr:Uncharacterised protein [Mycobacteroides abscessus subsp. abscessus]